MYLPIGDALELSEALLRNLNRGPARLGGRDQNAALAGCYRVRAAAESVKEQTR
jgi:hypothetical protein